MAVTWSYPQSNVRGSGGMESSTSAPMTGTWTSETRTTEAGTPYTVPGYTRSTTIKYIKPYTRMIAVNYYPDPTQAAQGRADLTAEYDQYALSFEQKAEQGDLASAVANAAQATMTNQENLAGQTQEFIDQETINPNETNQFFEDIAAAYNPGESRGDFYDRSVQDQQTSLDRYQSDTGFDAGNLDATVQGQVQIRDDILNQTVALASQDVANALTLLGAMGIDTSTMEEVTNPDGTTSYTTPEGQDLSSVISALGTSLGTKIDDAGAANLAALGYGGEGQDDLFTDIGRIQTTLGSGLDMSSVTDAVSQGFSDQQTYLGSQFGDIATGISGVGGQVTDVQATVDAVETAVGALDTRQLDMVTKLDNLGVDTDAIIAAVDAVQTTVDPLGGQVTDLGISTAQAVSGLGGDVAGLFGGIDNTSQVVDAVSTRLATDLGVGDSSLSSIASSIATVGEAQTDDQKALVAQIGQIQTGVTNMDSAIKTNIDDEFKNLMTVFDSDGQLITDFTNAAGEEVKAQLNDDGTLVVSTLTQLGTDVGNIDLSSLDTMKNSIDAAASSFDTAESTLGSFTSFETKSANDRKAVLDAIKADSTALDTLINTGIPQTISTGLADYKLEVGANDELLITNLAEAVGFDQSDVASATATAVGYNAQDLLDSIAEDALTDADLVNLSTLTLDDLPKAGEIAGAVNYDPDALMTRIKAGKADDLTAEDLTALSTLTVEDLPVAPTAASVASAVKVDLDSLQTNLANGALTVEDLSALSTLTVSDLPTTEEISGAVDYNPTDLLDKIKLLQPEVLTQDDLDVLSTLTTDDLSGLATQETASQAAASAASAVVSLGPISGISSNIDSLLTAADADATANGLRDNAIADSRQDVLTALSQDEGAMRTLFQQQTVDIEGELGAYNVRIDSETGSIVASQLSTQTSNLSGLIDTATGTLLTDSASGLTALEQDILDSKNDLYTTLNTSFTNEGELITKAINANGDDITRVLDDQGTLTETITDVNGIVQDTVVTNLSSIMDDTGRINTTALEIAADTNAESIFSTVQNVFDNQGLLKTEEYDRFNNLIIREFDENNDILERYYNADGTLSGEKVLRLEELLSSLFPDAPLAEAGELTGADKRFLQGFRTQGLMSGV